MNYVYRALQTAMKQEQDILELSAILGDRRRAICVDDLLRKRAAKISLETAESFESAYETERSRYVRELYK